MKSSIVLVSFFLLGVSSRPQIENYSVDLPGNDQEDCVCLSKTEERMGNVIKGQYSYIDPVGSLIEVNYSMNTDKTDYVEDRRVYKNYVNSGVPDTSGGLSAEEIVEKVLKDLTPTVIQVVRVTVQGSEVDLSAPGAQAELVQTIIIRLRPVVFRVVEQALIETSSTYLDAGDLTDLIITQLTPIVEQGVSNESANLQESVDLQNFELQVVQEVSQSLKPTIIRIIQVTVAESSVDLSNFEVLFETIITALKPVVYTEVDRALTSSKYANKIDPNTLAQKIILEISPYVREALQKEVKRIQDNTLTEDQVVQLVITDLKPTIIRVVQATVASENVDLSNIDGLLRTILVQLRPVVLNAVNNAMAQSTVAGNINADSLTDRIIREITTFVRLALEEEVLKATSNLENEVVEQVITELKPTVIRIIQATVSSSEVDLSNIQDLLETILTQLRPVVLAEVNNALQSSTYQLNAESLTDRIVTELRPFVLQALKAEVEKIRKVKTEQIQAQVTTQVVTDLESNIVDVIKETVSAEGANLDDTKSLVQLIIERLRPVIFEAVKKALQSESFEVDADDLTIRIIIEITPFVETGVKEEVIKQKEQNEGLIKTLSDRLGPAIINTIQGLDFNPKISDDMRAEILRVIPPRMTSAIRSKVSALPSADFQNFPESILVERIVADLQGDIINVLRADAKYSVVIEQKGFGELMQDLISILRPIIMQEIQTYKLSLVPEPEPEPLPTGDLSSIFGVGGQNFVKVDTPTFNYGYETSNT